MSNNDEITANLLALAYIHPEVCEKIDAKYDGGMLTRIRHSISQSGKNTTLKSADYKKIRDLHAQENMNSAQISAKIEHDRSIVSKIIGGLLHLNEFNKLSAQEQLKYLEEYLIPKFLTKDALDEQRENMTDQEILEYNTRISSINKRKIRDIKLMCVIVSMKLDICKEDETRYYRQQEIIDMFKDHPEYNKLSPSIITNLWNSRTPLFQHEFTADMPITYQKYVELVNVLRPRKVTKH